MKSTDKTKEQLLKDVSKLRREVARIKKAETECRQREEALKETEARLGAFVNSATEAFTIFDEDLNLVDLNPTAFGYLPPGTQKSDVIGKNILDFVPYIKDTVRYERYLEIIRNGGSYHEDGVVLYPGPDQRYLSVRAFKVGKGLGIITSDITEQKRMEEAMRESEQTFRNLAEHSPNMIFINVRGRVAYANVRTAEVMGYTREEFCSPDFDFLTLIDPESLGKLKDNLAKHMRGEDIPPYEYSLQTKDGKRIEAIISTKLIHYHGETAILGIITDITERKRAEEAIQDSEARFKALVENAFDGIAVFNAAGEITYASPASLQIGGVASQEALGTHIIERIHPDDRPRIIDNMACAFAEPGATVGAQYRILHRDGSWHVLETLAKNLLNDPKVAGIVVNFRDITERVRIEDALRQSEEKYRLIADNTSDFIAIADLEGRYTYVSPSHTRLGYDPADLIGKSGVELMHPDDLMQTVDRMNKYLDPQRIHQLEQSGQPIPPITLEYRTRDKWGNYHHHEAVANIVIDALGKRHRLVIVSRDITERKRAEESLRESEEKYRSVVDNVGIGISLISPNMEILTLNKQMEKWFPDIDVTKKPICYRAFNSPPQETICSYCPTCQTLQDGQVHESVTETPSRPEVRNFRIVSSPIKDRQGNVIAAIEMVDDITERKRAGEAVAESERKLSTLMGNLPGIAYRCANDQNWTMYFLSEGCRNLTGYAPEDLLYNRRLAFNDIINSEHRERIWNEVQAALSAREHFSFEYTITPVTGAVKWVWEKGCGVFSPDGEVEALEGFISDITERRQAEQALKESEERFRSLIENSADGIAVIRADGTMAYTGPSNERILGYDPAESPGSATMFDHIHPDDRARLAENFDPLLQIPHEVTTEKYRTRHQDGTWRIIEATGTNLLDNPIIRGVVVNFRDVTERERAEESLKQREYQLRTIFENANDAILYLDNVGNVVECNQRIKPENSDWVGGVGWARGMARFFGILDGIWRVLLALISA